MKITKHIKYRYVERVMNVHKDSHIEYLLATEGYKITCELQNIILNARLLHETFDDNDVALEHFHIYKNIILVSSVNDKEWITLYQLSPSKMNILKDYNGNINEIKKLEKMKRKGDTVARQLEARIQFLNDKYKEAMDKIEMDIADYMEKEILKSELELAKQIQDNMRIHFKIVEHKLTNEYLFKQMTGKF